MPDVAEEGRSLTLISVSTGSFNLDQHRSFIVGDQLCAVMPL